MYKNLRAEIARADLSVASLAKKCGMTRGTLYSRIEGRTPFSLDEAHRIKRALGVELTLEELFMKKED